MTGHVLGETHYDNGYGVSVIDDGYGSENAPYEIALIDEFGRIVNVEGWLTLGDVTAAMRTVESAPSTMRADHVWNHVHRAVLARRMEV